LFGDSRHKPRGRQDLPRAINWHQYDYYDFLTCPELRPPDPTGEKAFWETIKATRTRLSKQSVLESLGESRQLELAALVSDSIAKHEMYESFRKAMAALRDLSNVLGPRKLAKLGKAAAILRSVATTVPEHHPNAPGVSLKDPLFALDQFLQQLPWKTKQDVSDYIIWTKKKYPQTSDPAIVTTCNLFWFLASKCGLEKNEAEVRVAKIGNACLSWHLRYTEVYQDPDGWKGCPAVRRRIDRHCKTPREPRTNR
jgi:hypothetical protein